MEKKYWIQLDSNNVVTTAGNFFENPGVALNLPTGQYEVSQDCLDKVGDTYDISNNVFTSGAATVRKERNNLLDKSDKEIMKIFDNATSWSDLESLRSAWKTYRQALRDVPVQSEFPGNVTWPTKPS